MKDFMKTLAQMTVLGAAYGAAIVVVGKTVDKIGSWISSKSRKEEEF